MRTKRTDKADFQIVPRYHRRLLKKLGTIRSFLRARPGNYVTLAHIGPDRAEKQLQRASIVEAPRQWLQQGLMQVAQSGTTKRFRLRFWHLGGRSASGMVFAVQFSGTLEEPHPPASHNDEVSALREELHQKTSAAEAERRALRAEVAQRLAEAEVLAERLLALESRHEELQSAVIRFYESFGE